MGQQLSVAERALQALSGGLVLLNTVRESTYRQKWAVPLESGTSSTCVAKKTQCGTKGVMIGTEHLLNKQLVVQREVKQKLNRV